MSFLVLDDYINSNKVWPYDGYNRMFNPKQIYYANLVLEINSSSELIVFTPPTSNVWDVGEQTSISF